MKSILTGFLFLTLSVLCLYSCSIDDLDIVPRWSISLRCDGKAKSRTSTSNPIPVYKEYTHPEFFIIKDSTVFRFNDEEIGLELQFPTSGHFIYGQRYEYKAGDRWFDARFDWIYNSESFSATSGWVTFNRSLLYGVSYTISFEFDAISKTGNTSKIRNGLFTVYEKSEPRNTEYGLKDK